MPKLPAKYASLLFAFLMSLLMCGVMTICITVINTGTAPGFWARWLHAFVLAWPLAFVCVLLFAPLVRRIVAHCVQTA